MIRDGDPAIGIATANGGLDAFDRPLVYIPGLLIPSTLAQLVSTEFDT